METPTRPVVRDSVANAIGTIAAGAVGALAGWAWQRMPSLPLVTWLTLGFSVVALVIALLALYFALKRNRR